MSMNEWTKMGVSREVYEKTKKNVLWIGIISIVMLFAGLSSAYIVSMSDTFWVEIAMPKAFWMSTLLVVLGSVALWFSVYFAKRNSQKGVLYSVLLTIVLGGTFTWSQFKGWGEMIDKGNYFISNVYNFLGGYGKYYAVKYKGQKIVFDGEHYYINGTPLSASQMEEIKAFLMPIYEVGYKFTQEGYNMPDYGKDFVIITQPEGDELELVGGKLLKAGNELSVIENSNLMYFSRTVTQGFGYFNLVGVYGKDFVINFLGEQLDFKKGALYFQPKELGLEDFEIIDATFNDIDANSYTFKNGVVKDASGKEVTKEKLSAMNILFPHKGWSISFKDGKWYREARELNENEYSRFYESRNTASSYIYIFTVAHLLHLIGGLFYIIYLLSVALKGEYNSSNHLQLRLGGIYWHFLGGLWIYLFLFFQFIH
ncbi:MAG: hypothetical protein ACK4K0_07515 [Flavobacteriales bacterium]